MAIYNSQTPRHKVFVSFHSDDQEYKNNFERQWGSFFNGFVSRSVQDGDINPNVQADTIRQNIRDKFIADATVTIVLVGNGTWRRKHVDWEIAASIRDTKNNSRTGLIGILLPSYSTAINGGTKRTENGELYFPRTIPPRLHDNIENGFAKIYSWPHAPNDLQKWIHEAFQRRKQVIPDNSYPSFSQNRSYNQPYWQ